jgi:hypothetical protein
MPIVLLVRHGQASFGDDDYDRLSELGRRQAERTGRWLVDRGLRRPVAMHGSLRRQRDTASLALDAAGLRVEPRIDPRWDEYDHIDLVRRYAAAHGSEKPRSSHEFQVLLDSALTAWVEHGDEGAGPRSPAALPVPFGNSCTTSSRARTPSSSPRPASSRPSAPTCSVPDR